MSGDAIQVRDAAASYVAQAAAEEVPAGYKRTEVGVIPEDWEVVEIGNLKPFVTSGSRGWARYYSESGASFLRIGNLSRHSIYLDLEDLKHVRLPRDAAEAARTEIQDGDLLISITADIGIVGWVSARVEKPGYINQHLALIRINQADASSRFITYSLASERSQRGFVASTDVGAKTGMNLATIRKIGLALPRPAEQRAIAEALSDVDGLLGALEALIAKKRAIKQAAMQQLLTGRTRLPGFSKEWSSGPLSTVVESLQGGVSVNSTEGEPSPSTACVLKTSALTGGIFLPNEAKPIEPRDISRARSSPKRDTILISRMNTPDLVGEVAYVGRDYPWLFLPDRVWMTHFRNNTALDVSWLAYVLSSSSYRRMLKAAATGTSGSMKNIPKTVLLALPIQFPTPDEQAAIAAVLSDMDAEITVLEARRDKTRAIKQGMMQQLLTGRIRLVEPATARVSAC